MIIQAVSNALADLLGYLVSIMPGGSSWAPTASGVQGVMGQVAGLNENFPIDVAAGMFAIWLGFQITSFGSFVTLKVYSLFKSGGST